MLAAEDQLTVVYSKGAEPGEGLGRRNKGSHHAGKAARGCWTLPWSPVGPLWIVVEAWGVASAGTGLRQTQTPGRILGVWSWACSSSLRQECVCEGLCEQVVADASQHVAMSTARCMAMWHDGDICR